MSRMISEAQPFVSVPSRGLGGSNPMGDGTQAAQESSFPSPLED